MFLPGQVLAHLLPGFGISERPLGLLVPASELVGQLVLILGQLAGLLAHLGNVFAEPVGRLLPEVFAEVLELALGSGPFVERLRDLPFFEGFGGLPDLLASLVDLGASFGHPVAVLLALHPLADLVGVAEDLLFLVAKPLQLPLGLGLRVGSLGGFEGSLQLLEPLVQVSLPPGEFGQPVENLPGFALLGFRLGRVLRLGGLLLFVAVLVVGQLQLVELLLRG